MSNILNNPANMSDKNELLFNVKSRATNYGISYLYNDSISGNYKWIRDHCDSSGNILHSFTSYSKNNFTINGGYPPDEAYAILRCYKHTTCGGKTMSSLSLSGGFKAFPEDNPLDISSLIKCKKFSFIDTSLYNVIWPASEVSVNYLNLKGTNFTNLDLSSLSGLHGYLNLDNTKFLRSITFPESDNPFTSFTIYNSSVGTDSSGILDFSLLHGFGGDVTLGYLSVNSIKFPSSNTPITNFNIYRCSNISTIDVSSLSVGGKISLYNNTVQDISLILPTNSNTEANSFTTTNIRINGPLDFSGMHKLGGVLNLGSQTNITDFKFGNSDVPFSYFYITNTAVTSLDISGLNYIGGNFTFRDNPSLNTMTFPSSDVSIQLNLQSNRKVLEYDLLPLTRIAINLRFDNCSSLKTIKIGNSPEYIGTFNLYNCKSLESLDVSGLSKLGGTFDTSYDNSLKHIIFPNSSEPFTLINLTYSGLLELDFTPLKGFGGQIIFQNNPNLSNVLFPDSSRLITNINGSNCKLGPVIDISCLTNFSTTSSISFSNNSSLNKVYFAPNDLSIYSIGLSNCNITDTFDVSNCKILSSLIVGVNKITDLILPNTNTLITLGANTNKLHDVIDISLYNRLSTIYLYQNPSLGDIIFPDKYPGGTILVNDCSLGPDLYINEVSALVNFSCQNNKKLKYIHGSLKNYGNISTIDMFNCDITGTLDISSLNRFRLLEFYDNPNLTKIILGDSSLNSIPIADVYFRAYNCNLTGTLDMRGFSPRHPGEFSVYNNPNLTEILVADTSESYSKTTDWFYAYNCDISGTLDLTPIKRLGGYIRLYNNPGLTEIKIGSSDLNVNEFIASNCNITGTLDVSGLKDITGTFDVSNNTNLTSILFNSSSNLSSTPIIKFSASNCNLTGVLDVSRFHNLGGTGTYGSGIFDVAYNPNLTNIYFNSDISPFFVKCFVNDCNLSGVLDLTGVHLGSKTLADYAGYLSYFNAANNPNLTNILFSETSLYIARFNCSSCNLTEAFDLSKLKGLCQSNYDQANNYIDLRNNPNLTSALFDSSLSKVSNLYLQNCNLTGSLDLSKLGIYSVNPRGAGEINLNNNPNLTNIYCPSALVTNFYAKDCNLTGVLDLSTFVVCGQVNFSNNPNLAGVVLSNKTYSPWNQQFNFENCGFTADNIDLFLERLVSIPIIDSFWGVDVILDGGLNEMPNDGYNNQYWKILDGSYSNFNMYINYDKTPFLIIDASNVLNSYFLRIAVSTVDGSIIDIDTGLGQKLMHTNDTQIIVSSYNDIRRPIKLYDGSTSGASSITSLTIDEVAIKDTLDISCLVNLNSLTIQDEKYLKNIIYPNSSLGYLSIKNSAYYCNKLDLSSFKYLNTLQLESISGFDDIVLCNDSSYSWLSIIDTSIQILDMSSINWKASGDFYFSENNRLSNIIFPNSSDNVSVLQINDNSVLSTIDVMNIKASNLRIYDNPILADVSLGNNPSYTAFYINNCPSLTSVDLSLGGSSYSIMPWLIYNNTNLSSIKFPSGISYDLAINDNSLNGSIDLTTFTTFGNSIQVQNNVGLTNIKLPNFTMQPNKFIATNCSLDVSTVDDILFKCNTWFSSNIPIADASIYLNGPSNSSPTDGSANIDLVNCVSIFTSAGRVFDFKGNI